MTDVSPLLISDTASAALLGVSRAHLHRLRSAGKLPPAVKLGRAVRWSRADLETFVAAGCDMATYATAKQRQKK